MQVMPFQITLVLFLSHRTRVAFSVCTNKKSCYGMQCILLCNSYVRTTYSMLKIYEVTKIKVRQFFALVYYTMVLRNALVQPRSGGNNKESV